MNKKILIVGGVVVVIAGALAFITNRNNSSQQQISKAPSPQASEEAVNLVLSAFEGNGSVKCTYNNNDSVGTAYVKNGMVRVEGTTTSDDRDGNLILKNDTLWAWETGDDTGFMLTNVSQFQEDSADIPEGYTTNTSDIKRTIEESNPTCNVENIPDSAFDPPVDVKFQDYSSMNDSNIQIPDDFKLPEGVELPEGN